MRYVLLYVCNQFVYDEKNHFGTWVRGNLDSRRGGIGRLSKGPMWGDFASLRVDG